METLLPAYACVLLGWFWMVMLFVLLCSAIPLFMACTGAYAWRSSVAMTINALQFAGVARLSVRP